MAVLLGLVPKCVWKIAVACVTVESLRNSVSSIYQYLGQWFALRLKFKDQRRQSFSLPARLSGWRFPCDHEVGLAGRGPSTRVRQGRAPSLFDMPGRRGRCGAHRGHVQDILALHIVEESRWVTLAGHGCGRGLRP